MRISPTGADFPVGCRAIFHKRTLTVARVRPLELKAAAVSVPSWGRA